MYMVFVRTGRGEDGTDGYEDCDGVTELDVYHEGEKDFERWAFQVRWDGKGLSVTRRDGQKHEFALLPELVR